jgi:hypothetical protein
MTINNPLPNDITIWSLAINALNVIIPVSSILFVIMIVYGGISYILNQTDTDKVKGAQTIIKNALIGLVIVVSAFVILRFVEKAIYGS